MRRALLLACGLIIVALVVEIMAQAYYRPWDHQHFLEKNREFFTSDEKWEPSTPEEKERLLRLYPSESILWRESGNPRLGHELVPHSRGYVGWSFVSLNSEGLRDREYNLSKADGSCRIAVLGDSFTFGDGNDLNDTYVKILERLLNDAGGDKVYEVINFGVYGYNIIQIDEMYKTKTRKYSPDIVLYGYFLNDPEGGWYDKCGFTVEEIDGFIQAQQPLSLYFLKTHLARGLDTLLSGRYFAYHKGLHSDSYMGWVCTKKILTELLGEDVLTILFIVPSLGGYGALNTSVYSKVGSVGAVGNYYDLPTYLEKERERFSEEQLYGTTHYSNNTNWVIARGLQEYLTTRGILC